MSFVSAAFLKNPTIAAKLVAAAANDALQEYVFGVVPLFVLMGLLVTVSGVGRDTFDVCEAMLRKIKIASHTSLPSMPPRANNSSAPLCGVQGCAASSAPINQKCCARMSIS